MKYSPLYSLVSSHQKPPAVLSTAFWVRLEKLFWSNFYLLYFLKCFLDKKLAIAWKKYNTESSKSEGIVFIKFLVCVSVNVRCSATTKHSSYSPKPLLSLWNFMNSLLLYRIKFRINRMSWNKLIADYTFEILKKPSCLSKIVLPLSRSLGEPPPHSPLNKVMFLFNLSYQIDFGGWKLSFPLMS